MGRTLSMLGILLSLAYVAGLFFLFGDRLAEVQKLTLNEIGDLLAGVFGPVAILWLILGFFQQGIELRQNTRALELQAKELQNSVEQQRDLVEVTRKQFEISQESISYERQRESEAIRPRFIFGNVSTEMLGPSVQYRASIRNMGGTATHLNFIFNPEVNSSIGELVSWDSDDIRQLTWTYKTPLATAVINLTINYIDKSGAHGYQKFEFTPDENSLRKIPKIVQSYFSN